MKKNVLVLATVTMFSLIACNNAGESSRNADSTGAGKDTSRSYNNDNDRRNDTSARQTQNSQTTPMQADRPTTDFLTKAADGGMTEVNISESAQQKATSNNVKSFAAMMVRDHGQANAQLKSLSSARNLNLPSEPSAEHKKMTAETEKKSGKAFDKAYMDMMVSDHKKTIDLFEKGLKETNDQEVKGFINSTLPVLKAHLDSATAVRKSLR